MKAGCWGDGSHFDGYFSAGEVVGAALGAKDLATLQKSTKASAKAGKASADAAEVAVLLLQREHDSALLRRATGAQPRRDHTDCSVGHARAAGERGTAGRPAGGSLVVCSARAMSGWEAALSMDGSIERSHALPLSSLLLRPALWCAPHFVEAIIIGTPGPMTSSEVLIIIALGS